MTATAQDFLFFAKTRRAAAQAEVDACDAAIAALTAPPVDPPAPDPEPEPPVVVDPGPVDPGPAPNPGPVPNPPVVGRTVAVDATDLMTKVNALKGSGKDATIGLAAGHHDAVSLSGLDLGGGARLTIIAEARRASKLSGVTLVGGCRNINFVGLGICPKGDATAAGLGSGKLYGFRADQTTSKIVLDDMMFQGHVESGNHAGWTLAEWRARGIGAAWLQGADSVIQRSYAEGVRFGFNLTGKGSVMRQLRVFGASGDGFRVSADNVTGEDLLATDLVFMNDGNHPDGFQAFGPVVNGAATPLRNLTLRRVALIEWTVRHDNPLRWNANLGRWGIMQGIGLHQTKFEDIVLDDIFVKTNVANGMHIGGAKNLSGQRWRVLSGDHGQSSFDKRFPKIDIHGSGAVSINDVEAQALTTATAALVKGSRVADYTVPDPTWLAPLMGLAG